MITRTLGHIGFGVLALAVTACTQGNGASPAPGQGARTIQVRMTDDLRFDPADFTVQAGETVRFVVTNAGQLVHEFLIGDEAAQAQFEMEMAEDGGMLHNTSVGVIVDPGQTETFEYTFGDAGGTLLAGCHEPGHHAGGMVATITVATG